MPPTALRTIAPKPVDPETVGLSSPRLARIHDALTRDIAAGLLPGAVVAIMRRGQLAYLQAVGVRCPATREALGTDALFSIASMTKPMTSAAILLLVEEGRVLLGDSITAYLPQLAGLQVATPDGSLRSPKAPVTIQDLLRHTSGMTYGERGATAAHARYPSASMGAAETLSKEDMLAALVQAPLLFDPGTDWEYGFSTDVLGFVVEAVTGQTLGGVLLDRIWEPLGMVDTTFALSPDMRSRYALPLLNDPLTGHPNPPIHHAVTNVQRWQSGGAGCVSTASDYLRFAEMMRRGGRGGVGSDPSTHHQILGRATIALMTADHLPTTFSDVIAENMDPAAAGYGFGLGVAVRRQAGLAAMAGSRGDFAWSGVYGTYFWVDPKEELSVVFLAATPSPVRLRYRQMIRNLVYQALTT
jgi:CubicO group peptidase (beta-lactamase class C family)